MRQFDFRILTHLYPRWQTLHDGAFGGPDQCFGTYTKVIMLQIQRDNQPFAGSRMAGFAVQQHKPRLLFHKGSVG